MLAQSVELGRACIARGHRNRKVLFLLWKALARYCVTQQKRFLFGCCSLSSQEAREGRQLLRQLANGGYLHPTFCVLPKPGQECETEPGDDPWPGELELPRLFSTYLGIGAKVCGTPAIDRLFKTIDFFVVFDIHQMDAKTRQLFFEDSVC
jgi:putative hemolysin